MKKIRGGGTDELTDEWDFYQYPATKNAQAAVLMRVNHATVNKLLFTHEDPTSGSLSTYSSEMPSTGTLDGLTTGLGWVLITYFPADSFSGDVYMHEFNKTRIDVIVETAQYVDSVKKNAVHKPPTGGFYSIICKLLTSCPGVSFGHDGNWGGGRVRARSAKQSQKSTWLPSGQTVTIKNGAKRSVYVNSVSKEQRVRKMVKKAGCTVATYVKF